MTAASAPLRVAALDLRTQRWFNPTRNYKHWMVPALMVSLTTTIGAGGRGESGEALRVMRAVLMRGAGLETVDRPILGLAAAGVAVLALAVMRYRKSVA
jgi:hypothetical protein